MNQPFVLSKDCLLWHRVKILNWVVISSEKNWRLQEHSPEYDQSILIVHVIVTTSSFQNLLLFSHGVTATVFTYLFQNTENALKKNHSDVEFTTQNGKNSVRK